MPAVLLTYYCVLIVLTSLVGGMIPVWFQLTHRGMQFAISFVAGVMLGVGVLHMLAHAIADAAVVTVQRDARAPVAELMLWLLAGVLVMFFMERFFCFHHHDAPGEPDAGPSDQQVNCEHGHEHAAGSDHSEYHRHSLSWGGALFGLALHSVINGIALAAAVEHGSHGVGLAGFGTFLVIALHKPFDAMTIGTLMARSRFPIARRVFVNALFPLAVPLGAALFYLGLAQGNAMTVPCALAFSAGTFLCISLSDLLPELQFHQHDRVKLSLSLVAGLAVAYAAAQFESHTHSHEPHATAASATQQRG